MIPSVNLNNQNNNWWVHFQPSKSAGSLESKLSITPVQGMAAVGMPSDWSIYDDKKLQYELKILTNIAIFLRLISSPTTQTDNNQAMQSVRLKLIIEVFCKCASYSQHLSQSTSDTKEFNSLPDTPTLHKDIDAGLGMKWLRSPQPLSSVDTHNFSSTEKFASITTSQSIASDKVPSSNYVISQASNSNSNYPSGKQIVSDSLHHIAENLICVIHNLIMYNPSQLTQNEFETIEKTAAKFPSHSLIRQAARWSKDYLK